MPKSSMTYRQNMILLSLQGISFSDLYAKNTVIELNVY